MSILGLGRGSSRETPSRGLMTPFLLQSQASHSHDWRTLGQRDIFIFLVLGHSVVSNSLPPYGL